MGQAAVALGCEVAKPKASSSHGPAAPRAPQPNRLSQQAWDFAQGTCNQCCDHVAQGQFAGLCEECWHASRVPLARDQLPLYPAAGTEVSAHNGRQGRTRGLSLDSDFSERDSDSWPLSGEQRRDFAIAQLEKAAVAKDIDKLRAALAAGQRAGLSEGELALVRAFLKEQESKAGARVLLAEAVYGRKTKALKAAIKQGESVHLLEDELRSARAILSGEEGKSVARSNLEAAYSSGNLERLRQAILDGEDSGLSSSSKLLAASRALIAVEDKRHVALMGLAAAAADRRVDRLTFALQEGRIAGLSASDLQGAQTVLAEEQQKSAWRGKLAEAVHANDEHSLPDAVVSDERNGSQEWELLDAKAFLARGTRWAAVPPSSTAPSSSMAQVAGEPRWSGVPSPSTVPSSSVVEIAPSEALDPQPESQTLARLHLVDAVQSPERGALQDALREASAAGLSDAELQIPRAVLDQQEAKHSENSKQEDVLQVLDQRFSGFDSLAQALGGGDTVLVKASWIIHCFTSSKVLPRRQELPPEAVWDARELIESLQTSPPVQIVAVSYCWRTALHPDPDGELLQVLSQALEYRLAHGSPGDDMAVFIDWCSLHQQPWVSDESEAYSRAREDIDLWYAHQRTAVWLLSAPPYEQRAWPLFELALASLATPNHMLLDLGHLSDKCEDWTDVYEVCQARRMPPLLPDDFEKLVKSRQLSVQDDRSFLWDRYRRSFNEFMASVWELNFHSVGWGDEEVHDLALALGYCSGVERLNLSNNRIGNAGAEALADAIRNSHVEDGGKLRTLRLGGNDIGEDGKWALKNAWETTGRDLSRLGL